MSEEYKPMFDFLKAKPRENQTQEQADIQTQTNEATLMAGATPLLVGLLSGHTGDGVEIAAKGVQQQITQGQKRQDSLMDYLRKSTIAKEKAASATGGKKRYQSVGIEDEKGNIRHSVFDTFTGSYNDTNRLRGFRKSVRKDPKTDELITTSGALGTAAPTIIEGAKETPFDVKSEKDVAKMRDDLFKDLEVKKFRSGVSSSKRALELLVSGNPIADEGMSVIFPRMFGEVGNLAAQEQAKFTGDPSILNRYQRFIERLSNKTGGTLSKEDRSDLIEVAQMMHEYDRRMLNQSISRYAGSYSKQTGITSKRLMEVIQPFTEAEAKSGNISKKVKKNFSQRLVGEDKDAYDWAMKNKKDPRSKKYLNHLKSKYGE